MAELVFQERSWERTKINIDCSVTYLQFVDAIIIILGQQTWNLKEVTQVVIVQGDVHGGVGGVQESSNALSAHAQGMEYFCVYTEVFRLVVQKSRRESAHA
jgi:hypothetical protein